METLTLPEVCHPELAKWIQEVVALCEPISVHLCQGTQEEADSIASEMVAMGKLIQLSPSLRPGSFLACSAPEDVARVESRTFICCDTKEDAGPTNNWRDPKEMKEHLRRLFRGCMKGRICYIIPFCMGPEQSPLARIGVQITDSPYVVLNMRLMTRMGVSTWNRLQSNPKLSFTKCWHSVGFPLSLGQEDISWPCNPKDLCIAHFPEQLEIWSYGSGYGGNALLGKKCLALRIASKMAKSQGWLAEHMLIMSLTNPSGKKYYFAAAFPSSCGKTNLAMLQPSLPGWKVQCLGDDIAWMWVDSQGQLRAINPEAGFFGVAPGTSQKTNPVAMKTIEHHTLFTNVARTDQGDVWWEGLELTGAHITDWKGRKWSWDEHPNEKAAHPNARFTVSIQQCPILDPAWNDPQGVPISAIIFGGRRANHTPLVLQAHDWTHGVLLGACLGSETTAAAEGKVGELRHDPFAMLPFCGYHMGDYFHHWLEIGQRLRKKPLIFHVNWFRRDETGKFIWPGYGDNIRVLDWMIQRIEGKAISEKTPIGILPKLEEICTQGLSISSKALKDLLTIEPEAQLAEIKNLRKYFTRFQPKFPASLMQKLSEIEQELNNSPL